MYQVAMSADGYIAGPNGGGGGLAGQLLESVVTMRGIRSVAISTKDWCSRPPMPYCDS
jgi:hypothetical protein